MSETVTLDQLMQPKPAAVDVDAHQKDLTRRQRERDERCPLEERLRLCSPVYAREVEEKKPLFKFTVTAVTYERRKPEINSRHDDFEFDAADGAGEMYTPRSRKGVVVAQNEQDAWAMFCDRIGEWPSPKLAKPTFSKGEQINGPGAKSKK